MFGSTRDRTLWRAMIADMSHKEELLVKVKKTKKSIIQIIICMQKYICSLWTMNPLLIFLSVQYV